MKFKEGDVVKLITERHGISNNNPVWGSKIGYIKGVITGYEEEDCLEENWVEVKWENDKSNLYKIRDLKYVDIKKYDSETIDALDGSINKWENVVNGALEDEGGSNCPLCQMFDQNGCFCAGCPVKDVSGKSSCCGTPYDAWGQYIYDSEYYSIYGKKMIFDKESKRLAVEMLNYLKNVKYEVEKKKEEKFYHSGMIFEQGGNKYILGKCGKDSLVTLVNLKTGNAWCEPVVVKHSFKITEEEMESLNMKHYFKLIED